MSFWPNDWSAFLLPDAPVAELVVRGTLIYWFLFLLMRLVGRRLLARLAMSDMLVMLLIAVAVREGITGGWRTVGDAAISAATILVWDLLVDRIAYHVPSLRKPLRHSRLPIILHGELLARNAREQLLTRQEIRERLHEEGLTGIAQVEAAWMEPDGSISVIPR